MSTLRRVSFWQLFPWRLITKYRIFDKIFFGHFCCLQLFGSGIKNSAGVWKSGPGGEKNRDFFSNPGELDSTICIDSSQKQIDKYFQQFCIFRPTRVSTRLAMWSSFVCCSMTISSGKIFFYKHQVFFQDARWKELGYLSWTTSKSNYIPFVIKTLDQAVTCFNRRLYIGVYKNQKNQDHHHRQEMCPSKSEQSF